MNGYSAEFWLIFFGACLGVIIGFTLFARWAMHSPAVSQKKLDQLRVGMTTLELETLLGKPRQKRSGEDRIEHWMYGAQWKRHVLVVEFNGSGKMREFVHGVPNMRKHKHTNSDQ